MEPLFHFALALLNAGAFWLAAVIVVAIALAIVGPVRLSLSNRRPLRQAEALMSMQRDSYTRQSRSRKASAHIPRFRSDTCSFMFLNYAALLQKGAPAAHHAKSKSGSTYTPMKSMEIFAARPLSLFLIAVVILSVGVTALCVGFAIHIAGPVSLHIPHVEIPAIEFHAGSAPVVAEPDKKAAARHHRAPCVNGRRDGTDEVDISPQNHARGMLSQVTVCQLE
jgi:hypothetical protein